MIFRKILMNQNKVLIGFLWVLFMVLGGTSNVYAVPNPNEIE